jgi:hypothetical protein
MKPKNKLRPSAVAARFVLSLSSWLCAHAASAAVGTWVSVNYIEVSRVPDVVYFQVDQPVGNCPAGAYVKWEGGAAIPRGSADDSIRRANVRYIAQTLHLQKVINAKVVIWVTATTDVQYCAVENIHIP